MNEELWCLHVYIQDEGGCYVAAPSKQVAELSAPQWTEHAAAQVFPSIPATEQQVTAEPWPFDAESHAESLQEWAQLKLPNNERHQKALSDVIRRADASRGDCVCGENKCDECPR